MIKQLHLHEDVRCSSGKERRATEGGDLPESSQEIVKSSGSVYNFKRVRIVRVNEGDAVDMDRMPGCSNIWKVLLLPHQFKTRNLYSSYKICHSS